MSILANSVLVQLIFGTLLATFTPWGKQIESFLSWSSMTVIGLFMMVGLQIQIKKFKRDFILCGTLVFITTVVPMALFYGISRFFDMTHLSSFAVAVVLVTTGTGVTIQTLSNMGMLHSESGQFLTLVSALDDIPAAICMALLMMDAPIPHAGLTSKHIQFLIAALIILVATFFILRKFFNGREWVLSILFLAFGVTFSKGLDGLQISTVIGGLLSGFVLSVLFKDKTDKTEKPIEQILKPLVPFYMVFIGMKLTPSVLMEKEALIFSAVILVVAIASKWVCTYYLMRGQDELHRRIVSWGMVPRGIPGFAFASAAVSSGVISEKLFTILILLVSVATWIGLLGLEINLRKAKKTG